LKIEKIKKNKTEITKCKRINLKQIRRRRRKKNINELKPEIRLPIPNTQLPPISFLLPLPLLLFKNQFYNKQLKLKLKLKLNSQPIIKQKTLINSLIIQMFLN